MTGDIVLNIGSGVDFSARPNIYGGTLNGYTGALNSTKGGQAAVTAAGTGRTVTGNITMNLTGASLLGLVHGGSYNSSVAALVSRVTNDITINVSGATHQTGPTGWLFGGGFANGAGAQDYVGGTCSVNVSGGSDLNYVLGGGRAEKGGTANAGGANISISGGIFREQAARSTRIGPAARRRCSATFRSRSTRRRTGRPSSTHAMRGDTRSTAQTPTSPAAPTSTHRQQQPDLRRQYLGAGRGSSETPPPSSRESARSPSGLHRRLQRRRPELRRNEFSGGTSVTLTKREADAVNSWQLVALHVLGSFWYCL
ncbi:MAG: hypothetical protein V8T86_01900 [Victivallis sp.]